MSRRSADTSLEMAAAFQVDVDMDAQGSATIIRDGREIQQTLVVPRSDLLRVDALLYHRVDCQLYRVRAVKVPSVTLQRVSDGSEHDATLKDVKACMLLVVNSD